jgi:preprotein translocase subunit SecB
MGPVDRPKRSAQTIGSDGWRRRLAQTVGADWRLLANRATRLALNDTEALMSETTTAPAAGAPAQPPLVVNIQYVKDMSFEVPGAPAIYSQLRAAPQVNINLDVQARRIAQTQESYEVSLVIRAEAHEANTPPAGQTNGQAELPPATIPATVFVAELTYAGVFTLKGLPENAVEPVLLVECPRILFPFARNILADVTRDGGFPPVLLQPIDFVALWQSRRNQAGTPASPLAPAS